MSVLLISGTQLGCGKLWGGLQISKKPISVALYTDQSYHWALQLGETATSITNSYMATDPLGNIYVTGVGNGYYPSCSGISANCVGASQGNKDYFISKYSTSGAWIWTVQLGQTGTNSTTTAISTDSNSNVYVTGVTGGNLASCSGVSALCVGMATGNNDVFTSKYTSAGVWVWTEQLGETGRTSVGQGVTADTSGNVYVAGRTDGNLASCLGVSAACVGGSNGGNDTFVIKYNSAGAWVWTQQLGPAPGTSSIPQGGIVVDAASSVYVGGITNGNLTSCSGISASCVGPSTGNFDYFITKYTTTGAWVWTVEMGEAAKPLTVANIAIDPSQNIYLNGTTRGNLVTCNGVSASCVGAAQAGGLFNDVFISKYSSSGAWQWTQQLGETGKTTIASSLATDPQSNVYLSAGTQGDLTTCQGVSASCSGLSTGTSDGVVVKYNSSGSWIWTQQFGDAGDSLQPSIAVDLSSNIYVSGTTVGNLPACNGSFATCPMGSPQGTSDYYLIKY